MYRILFCDDDYRISGTVRDYFTANGFDVTLAANGRQAAEEVLLHDFDLIILDVMMPVLDGLSACREIRKTTKAPVLFMSALGEEKDFLKGYSAGADDYITKPFPLPVLLEKCLAAIRRYKGEDERGVISLGGITLDSFGKKVFADGKEVFLSAKDFEMLGYLMSKKGIVLSRSLIISRVWGYDFEGEDRVVDTHIKNIRKALGNCAEQIRTVPGAGYVFEEGKKS